MNVTTVLSAIADQLDTISGLRVYDYPIGSMVVPAAVVGYPETITFDVSMGRGQDQIEIPVAVLAGKVSDRTAMDVLGPFLDGSGSSSVKAVLEAKNGTWTGLARVRVRSATVDTAVVGSVEYLAAMFTLDVYGGN